MKEKEVQTLHCTLQVPLWNHIIKESPGELDPGLPEKQSDTELRVKNLRSQTEVEGRQETHQTAS